jgi:phage gp46-like protein
MTDIRIVEIAQRIPVIVSMDWLLTPAGMLDETEELATAVTVALATDGLAMVDDELPGLPPDDDRRGWWGDLDAAEIWGAWPIGSRIWLLYRSKITDINYRYGSTLARAEYYTQQCLQPFIDNRLCSDVEVVASRSLGGNYSRIDVQVVLYRGPKTAIELRYAGLWTEMSPLA